MDEGFAFPREERLRLSEKGYKRLCELLDERDGQCIICGATWGLHHHHVRFRSAYGSDREDNMVCLCWRCHDVYAHGKKGKSYQAMFEEYLQSPKVKEWRALHEKALEKVYKMRRKKK